MNDIQNNNRPSGSGRSDPSGSVQHNCPAHFAEARKIVESWPEWKRNIGHRLDPGENTSEPAHDTTR